MTNNDVLLKEAITLLKKIEWKFARVQSEQGSLHPIIIYNTYPFCGNSKRHEHAKKCPLHEILSKPELQP
jgi:hypothetical protein